MFLGEVSWCEMALRTSRGRRNSCTDVNPLGFWLSVELYLKPENEVCGGSIDHSLVSWASRVSKLGSQIRTGKGIGHFRSLGGYLREVSESLSVKSPDIGTPNPKLGRSCWWHFGLSVKISTLVRRCVLRVRGTVLAAD